jgi:hypothetical protein
LSTTAHEKNARAWPPLHVKRSRAERKFVNQMRGMADVPWPARRFRVAPTFAAVETGQRCPQLVAVDWKRKPGLLGWVRKPLVHPIVCGGPLVLVPFKTRVRCSACAQRAKLGRRETRLLKPPATLLGLRVALQAAAVAGRIFGRKSHP